MSAHSKFMEMVTASGRVMRWHRQETIRQQSVGEHTYGVLWLVLLLTDFGASADLLKAALAHDMPEHVTGDMPAPTKRLPGVTAALDVLERKVMDGLGLLHLHPENLPPIESEVLSWADGLEGLMFCSREMDMGNTLIRESFVNYSEYLTALAKHAPNAVGQEILDMLKEKHRYE